MNGLRDRAPSMNHHTRQNATGFCGSPAGRLALRLQQRPAALILGEPDTGTSASGVPA